MPVNTAQMPRAITEMPPNTIHDIAAAAANPNTRVAPITKRLRMFRIENHSISKISIIENTEVMSESFLI